jgi:hypothetical protein
MFVTPWFYVEGAEILALKATEVTRIRGQMKPRIGLQFSADLI